MTDGGTTYGASDPQGGPIEARHGASPQAGVDSDLYIEQLSPHEAQLFAESLNKRFKAYFMSNMKGVDNVSISKTMENGDVWRINYYMRSFEDGSGSEKLSFSRFHEIDRGGTDESFISSDASVATKFQDGSYLDHAYYGQNIATPQYTRNSRKLKDKISEIADLLMPHTDSPDAHYPDV